MREALRFEVPPQAVAGTPSGTLPRTFSLASAAPDAAIITAAKSAATDPKLLVLRIYQPTNAPLPVTVHTAAQRRLPAASSLSVRGYTALESDLPVAATARLSLSGSADTFTFNAARALTTIGVGPR